MHMNHTHPGTNRSRLMAASALLPIALAVCIAVTAPRPLASQTERNQEIVATLSAGRVLFCVTTDAILVASVEGGGEPGSQPPALMPVNSGRLGVVLGANEWDRPGSGKPFRLDAALPKAAIRPPKPPSAPGAPVQPVDPNQ